MPARPIHGRIRARSRSQVRSTGQRTRGLLFVATVGALGALYAHAFAGFGDEALDPFFANGVYLGLEAAGVLLCASRALLVREHRVAWWCIAAGFSCWTAGDVAWTVLAEGAESPITNGLYLAFYPLCCAGVALLAAQGRERIAARMWI